MKIDPSKVNLTEADIEEYLWQNPQELIIGSGGLYRIQKWIARQFDVPSGRIDLLGYTVSGYPAVVEVKNVPIDGKAIAQVCRYAFDVQRILEIRENGEYEKGVVRAVVGPSINGQSFRECEACGVFFVRFEIELNMKLNSLSWSEDFRQDRDYAYAGLGDTEMWAEMDTYRSEYWRKADDRRASVNDEDPAPDTSDEYSDIILE